MIPASIRRHMKQTVTVAPIATVGSASGKTYGAAVSYSARIRHEVIHLGTDSNGNEIDSTTQVWLDRLIAIPLTSKVTLPDAPVSPPILKVVESPAGEGGQLGHTVIYL